MPMWCVVPLEMNENSLGQGYNRPTGCSAEKAPHATFNHSVVSLAIYVQQSSSELEHVLWGHKSCRSVGAYHLRNILHAIFTVN